MIVIIDCGGQYTHLIWRNCRDLDYEARIVSKTSGEEVLTGADAVILSGGPGSVTTDDLGLARKVAQMAKRGEWEKPLLGICLGHQLIGHEFGGVVEKGVRGEYGLIEIEVVKEDVLFKGLPSKFKAWASHFDVVKKLPPEFEVLAKSEVDAHEAMKHKSKNIFGIQFHAEVWHTENGEKILENFLKLSKNV